MACSRVNFTISTDSGLAEETNLPWPGHVNYVVVPSTSCARIVTSQQRLLVVCVRMQCESDRIVQNVEGTWLLAWRTWPGVVEMRVDIPRAALRVEKSVLRASMTGRGLAHLGAETPGCVPTILPYLVNRKTAHMVVLRVIPCNGAVHLSLVYFMYICHLWILVALLERCTCTDIGRSSIYRLPVNVTKWQGIAYQVGCFCFSTTGIYLTSDFV